MDLISIEDEVGASSRDSTEMWGYGLCVDTNTGGDAGHCHDARMAVADGIELAVDPSWSTVKWFTTTPFRTATAWTTACLARALVLALACRIYRSSACFTLSAATFSSFARCLDVPQ
jgi:hypothetical protein